jgi:hypothetical protein
MWQFWVTLIVGLWLLLGSGIAGVNILKDSYEVGYLLAGL